MIIFNCYGTIYSWRNSHLTGQIFPAVEHLGYRYSNINRLMLILSRIPTQIMMVNIDEPP